MKKRLLSVLLAALMIVSLLPTMALAEGADCTHTQKETTITNGESYQLNLFGEEKGWFKFEAASGGWKILKTSAPGTVGMLQNPYLAVKDGKLTYTNRDNASVWTYKYGAFSVSEKTMQRNRGYWWGWFYIPGWGSKTVTTTYYLNTVTAGKLSTGYVGAELFKTVSGEHEYGKPVYVDKTNHKYTCKYCGDSKVEAHDYDGTTHKCVCGAYDPAESSVKISVDVKEKTTKQYIGWWPWGYYKNVTTYTATIKTEAKGVKVTKVQYQLNGGRWATGTCASSDKPIESLKVKAWDNKGKLYEYEWPEEPPAPTAYNVTAQVQGDHGTATVKAGDAESTSKTTKAAKGTNLVFTATPEEGYEFDYWEVVSGGINIESVKNNAEINVTMPETALTLKAYFKAVVPSAYDIIVEADGHGTAKAQVGGTDVSSAAPEAEVILTATPKDGYAFKEWEIARGLDSITGNSFTMPSNEVKVKAIFEKEYTVEVEAGGHGSASADVTKGVSGKEVNLTISPDESYEVDQITVVRGGVTVENNKFTIGTADVKIKVTFKAVVPSAYDIIVEADGHGTAKAQVGGADVSFAAPEAEVTLTATPKDGYAFKEWEIARGLDSITGNSFTMPSNEVKVKAIFERVYNINLQTNEHGTVTATVDGETVTKAAKDAKVTLTTEPSEGYKFKEWSVVSGDVTVNDNQFTMPASNVTIMAVFEEIPAPVATYTVTFDLNGITGTAPEAQIITSGGCATEPKENLPTLENHTLRWFTKAATTKLSDMWDFDWDKVTGDITLYAQWTRTLESIVATNSDVPKADTMLNIPNNAWVNNNNSECKACFSEHNQGFILLKPPYQASDPFASISEYQEFIKVNDSKYEFEHPYGFKAACCMVGGKFTSFVYEDTYPAYMFLNGTYAPAPTISTIADVLATVEGGFPTSTAQNIVPENAWCSGTNHFAYVYSTALFIKQPTDEDGSKAGQAPILLNTSVTKNGDFYTYSHTIFNLIFKMQDGILTSIEISGSSATANTKHDGTYEPAAPAPTTYTVTFEPDEEGGEVHDSNGQKVTKITVPSGTTLSVSSDEITIGENVYTAVANSGWAFHSFDPNSGTITGATTIKVNFSQDQPD